MIRMIRIISYLLHLKHFASIQAGFYTSSSHKGNILPDVPKLHFDFESFCVTEGREQESELPLSASCNFRTCNQLNKQCSV